ncbi:hypothetical protein SHO565_06630 [Streptomyces sp. HO565]
MKRAYPSMRPICGETEDAHVGSRATAHMLYGVLVAVAFTAPAVTVGTRVCRTA